MATEVRYVHSKVDEDKDGNVKAVTMIDVQFDTTETPALRKGPADALDWPAVPQRGAVYKYNGSTMEQVFCTNRSADQDRQHYNLFHLTVNYASPTIDGGGDPYPFAQPTRYSYGSDYFQRVLEKDLNDTIVKNPAGDFYSEPVLVDDARPIIRVTRNEAVAPDAVAETYQNASNSSAVTINGRTYAARILKIKSITSGEPQLYGGSITYYVVTYELHINREGWKIKVLSKGSRSFDDGDGVTPEPIKDERGVIIPGESFLNASGFKISSSGTPYQQEFVGYKELDLNALGL